MNVQIIARRIVDASMSVALLLLMAWALIGEAAHEALGCAMLALTLAHLTLNRSWYRNPSKGSWSACRITRTAIDFLVLAFMIVSMVSGILLSPVVFAGLGIAGGSSLARLLHLVASYWGFCLMSVHLGMRWGVIAGMIRYRRIRLTMNGIGVLVAAYGLKAFIDRGIGGYLLLLTRFAFFDLEEPLPLFLADYTAIMALCVCIGVLISKIAVRLSKNVSH